MATGQCPIPEGEYHALITNSRTTRRAGTDYLDVTWRITAPLKDMPASDPARQVMQYIPLERTPDGHIELAFGMNLQLDMLRRAVGQAVPLAMQDHPWYPALLRGRGARVLVRHLRDNKTGEIQCIVHSVIEPGVTQMY